MAHFSQASGNSQQEILMPSDENDGQPVLTEKSVKEDEQKTKEEQEKRDKAASDLDEIEKIIQNDSSLCVNLMLLIIYIVLIIQILMEYRMSEIFGTRATIENYINKRITTNLFEIQKPIRIYNEYLVPIVYFLHDHGNIQNAFSLEYNPQIENEKTQNGSIFINNYNYYLASVIKVQLKHIDNDEEADVMMRKILTYQHLSVNDASQHGLKNTSPQYVNQISANISDNFKNNIQIDQTEDTLSVTIFLQNNITQLEATEIISYVKSQFNVSSLLYVEHNIYTFNPITEVLLKTQRIFDMNVQGRIKHSIDTSYGVYYKPDSQVQSNVIFALVIKSLYALMVFGQILYSVGKRVFDMFRIFLATRIFEFEIDLVLVTAQRGLNLIYVIFWFLMFSEFGQLELTPQVTLGQLEDLDNYLDNFSLYQTFAILTFIISIYDVIKIMTSFLPSFGVLLYTFTVAGKDILIFISFTAMMLISFIIIGNIIFGPANLALSSLGNSAFFCFEFLGGVFKFNQLATFNKTIGYIYGMFFMIFFVFILFPYFYGTIIYTYGQLRLRMQLPTQALAEIAADKSTAATMKWINLITFTPPKSEEQLEKEKKIKLESKARREREKEELKNKNKKKKKKVEEIPQGTIMRSFGNTQEVKQLLKREPSPISKKPDASSPSKPKQVAKDTKKDKPEVEKELGMKDIFMYNFLQLDIKNVIMSMVGMGQPDLLTKEQRIDEINKKMQEIKDRRRDQAKEMKRLKQESLFQNLKDGFCHMIFLIILIVGFTQQTLKNIAYDQESYIKNYFETVEFESIMQFQDRNYNSSVLETTENMNNFVTRVVLQEAALSFEDLFDQERTTQFGIIMGYDPVRVNFRLLQSKKINFYQQENSIVFRARPASNIFPSSGVSSDERTINFYKNGIEYQYIADGLPNTAFKAGGFSYFISQEISKAMYQYQKLVNDTFLSSTTGVFSIEFVEFNPTNDLYSFVTISFEILGSGRIENLFTINTFPTTLYKGERVYRIFLELIVLWFHYRFWIMFLKEWSVVWNNDAALDLTPFDMPPTASKVEQLLNLDLNDDKNTQIFNLVFAIINRCYKFFQRFLTSLSIMVQQTFFNILLITGILLMWIQIFVFWLRICFHSFRITFDFYDNLHTNLEPVGMFDSFLDLSLLYNGYNLMAAFILLNETFRVMVYFSFSAKLSLVLDIVANASLDIIFFMTMFCLILFAFASVGVMIFGYNNPDFQDLSSSIIKCIEIFLGHTQMKKSDGDDYALRDILFYFTLIIVILFVLIRMFIAILDGHFIELQANNDERKGLVDTIMEILKKAYDDDQKAKLEAAMEEDEEEEPIELSKWKIVRCCQEIVIYIKDWSIKIFKYGLSKFEEYKNKLFQMLFVQKVSDAKDGDEEGEEEKDENKMKVDLDFGEDEALHYNLPRLIEIEEIHIYNPKQQVATLMQQLTGKEMKAEAFKTTQVSTWISALEKGIKDVASNSMNFSSYYTPLTSNKSDWANEYRFQSFEEKQQNFVLLVCNQQDRSIDQAIDPNSHQHYAGRLNFLIHEQISKKPKDPLLHKEHYIELVKLIDQYFFFCLNIVLVKGQKQHHKRKNHDQSNQQSKPQQQPQQQQQQLQFDISLHNISQEIPILIFNEVDNQSVKVPKKQQSMMKTINQSLSLGNDGCLTKDEIINLSPQQMIAIFSRISSLFIVWSTMKLQDKIDLWFGIEQKDGFFDPPFLGIQHKVAFWNQGGWDKRTLHKAPISKEDLQVIEYNLNNQEVIIEEYSFIQLWKQLYISKQQCKDGENQQNEEMNQIQLPASQAQITFVQYILRGNNNLIEQVSQEPAFQKKLALLKNSHLSNDHKLMIWILMSPTQKIEMIMNQDSAQQAQFMILMLIEELYDNFIMLSKIQQDLSTELNTKIYLMYHNFSEFNALQTAVSIRQKFSKQSVQSGEDYDSYIDFLKIQLENSNESVRKYSDHLIKILGAQQQKSKFQGALPQLRKLNKPGVSLFNQTQQPSNQFQQPSPTKI